MSTTYMNLYYVIEITTNQNKGMVKHILNQA